jgi:hypothetical protein
MMCGQRIRTVLAVPALAGFLLSVAAPVAAQPADDPNPGALTFTGLFDIPTVYVFRGIVQETDPGFTSQPAGDLGIAFYSGDGGIKSAGVNFGVWNSLQTGSSGSDGPTERLHYEEDFYATLALGFGAGVSLGTTFTAYSSPNGMFTTVEELSFRVSKAHMLNPYGILAFELSDDGQADAGSSKGSYLELGVGPAFPLGQTGVTLTTPVKLGLSLSDYYEGPDGDEAFGFFDIGAQLTLPLKGVPSRFGSWNIHGGVDFFFLGDTTRLFNEDSSTKVVGLFGFGVTY